MANIGTIVTDNEVSCFLPALDVVTKDSREEIIIKAAEAIIENYCNRTFGSLSNSDEEYNINRELVIHGIIVKPSHIISLRNYPVDLGQDFIIKFVTSRDVTTGLPSATTTLNRNTYHVDTGPGLVTLFRNTALSSQALPSFPSTNSVLSFPEGTASMLVTYTSGFDAASMPSDLKMATLMVIGRFLQLSQSGKWIESNVQSEFGITNFLRVELTREEMFFLRKFKRPILM